MEHNLKIISLQKVTKKTNNRGNYLYCIGIKYGKHTSSEKGVHLT